MNNPDFKGVEFDLFIDEAAYVCAEARSVGTGGQIAGQLFKGKESAYIFTTPEQLIADFQQDIERWHLENRDA